MFSFSNFKKKDLLKLFFLLPLQTFDVNAAPVVDGKYDVLEGYSTFQNIIVKDKDGNALTEQGEFYTHIEGGYIYGLFSAPRTYVDNSYGDNLVGWGTDSHSFNHLLGSDKIKFELFDSGGTSQMTVEIDYLKKNKSAINPQEEFFAEGDVKSGDDTWLIDVASSLEYNSIMFNEFLEGESGSDPIGDDESSPLTTSSSSYDILDSTYDDWIFDVNYEFQISIAALGGGDFGEFFLDSIHASPNKYKAYTFEFTPPTDITTSIPEPSTYIMMSCFIMVVYVKRCRRPFIKSKL